MCPPKWLFFDLGNTLADETPWEERYRDASFGILRELAPCLAREHFDALAWSGGTRQDIRLVHGLLRETLGNAEATNRARIAWRDAIVAEFYQLVRPPAEAQKLLKACGGRFRLGVIANQHREVHAWMERTGLRKRFEVEVYDCDFGVSKPDERIFRIALDMASCAPNAAVMVGDRLDNDITPAKRLGMRTVWMRAFGAHARKSPASKEETPDAEADTFHDLQRLLISLR